MRDIAALLTALAIGYICFASVGLFLAKLIFPFLTKEELRKRRIVMKKRRTLMTTR